VIIIVLELLNGLKKSKNKSQLHLKLKKEKILFKAFIKLKEKKWTEFKN
jgi:hypothetical protein